MKNINQKFVSFNINTAIPSIIAVLELKVIYTLITLMLPNVKFSGNLLNDVLHPPIIQKLWTLHDLSLIEAISYTFMGVIIIITTFYIFFVLFQLNKQLLISLMIETKLLKPEISQPHTVTINSRKGESITYHQPIRITNYKLFGITIYQQIDDIETLEQTEEKEV